MIEWDVKKWGIDATKFLLPRFNWQHVFSSSECPLLWAALIEFVWLGHIVPVACKLMHVY